MSKQFEIEAVRFELENKLVQFIHFVQTNFNNQIRQHVQFN